MQSLKDSMKWDEDTYGCEYDLDVYHIVAVNDFNMGAMENKGLNVFNTAAVLAKPSTATDADFERVQVRSPPIPRRPPSDFPLISPISLPRAVDRRARVLPQLERQSRHLPRLVPAHAQGGPHRLPRPALFAGHDLRRRAPY